MAAALPASQRQHYPAMVAPIVNLHGEQIAIHKTFLRPDGSAKANLPKNHQRETCGRWKSGAVRLSEPRLDAPLLVAEGIKSAASAGLLFGLPVWQLSVLPASEALELPSRVQKVVIAADNDASLTGQRAALIVSDRWEREGRRVKILLPPVTGDDFNDILLRTAGEG